MLKLYINEIFAHFSRLYVKNLCSIIIIISIRMNVKTYTHYKSDVKKELKT